MCIYVITMELSKLHSCKKCRGKIVNIIIDHCGVTRCGYCNEVVDYKGWFKTTKTYETYLELIKNKNANNIQK